MPGKKQKNPHRGQLEGISGYQVSDGGAACQVPVQGGAFQPLLGGDLLHGQAFVPQQGGVFELVGIDQSESRSPSPLGDSTR